MSIPITKQSKPITKLKEKDKIWIHGKEMVVDKHYLFQDHGSMKEMIIEVFNPKNEKEYQIRYFDDQVESSVEVYQLEGDFQYVIKDPDSVGW